jgi:phenylpropionate dioxygenase-like ring-hydroxylating dioxygenase large terminal subunit
VIADAGRVSEELAGGATLPVEWYTDPAIHQLERERIFACSWQYVGRSDQVEEPGAHFASFAGHVPVVAIRGRDGSLNGFVNVCRHRGHIVAQGAGRREALQCPYHAWTYDLDGSLRRAPRSEREADFDPTRLSLLPVQIETWGPLVFANPDLEAPPLAETLDELPALVASGGLDVGVLRFRQRREWQVASNWKIGLENYLECYHCAVAHPGFSRVIDVDPDVYELRAYGLVLSQFGPVRKSALSGDRRAPYVPEGPVHQAQYHFVWPNLTFNIDPGPANLSVEAWRPDGPERTVGFSDHFFGEDVPDEVVQELIEFAAQVGAEDDALVESVHRGLGSRTIPHGRLLLNSEHLIQRFQRLVFDALTAPTADPADVGRARATQG